MKTLAMIATTTLWLLAGPVMADADVAAAPQQQTLGQKTDHVVKKVGDAVQTAGKAAVHGVQVGAQAAANGVKTAADATARVAGRAATAVGSSSATPPANPASTGGSEN